MSNMQFSFIP